MEVDLQRTNVLLPTGKCLRIHDGCCHIIEVARGLVWITQERDTRDSFVTEGESFLLDRNGLTIIEAFAPSVLVFASPR